MGAPRRPRHEDGGGGSGAAARTRSVLLEGSALTPGNRGGHRPSAGQGPAARPWTDGRRGPGCRALSETWPGVHSALATPPPAPVSWGFLILSGLGPQAALIAVMVGGSPLRVRSGTFPRSEKSSWGLEDPVPSGS